MSSAAPSISPSGQFWPLCRKYLWQRIIWVALVAYELFGVLLFITTGIDICIPCLWTTLFGVHCPGCGLTHATMSLMKLDFAGAWEHNPLVFIVLPAIIGFVSYDVYSFVKRSRAAA